MWPTSLRRFEAASEDFGGVHGGDDGALCRPVKNRRSDSDGRLEANDSSAEELISGPILRCCTGIKVRPSGSTANDSGEAVVWIAVVEVAPSLRSAFVWKPDANDSDPEVRCREV